MYTDTNLSHMPLGSYRLDFYESDSSQRIRLHKDYTQSFWSAPVIIIVAKLGIHRILYHFGSKEER